MSTKATKRKGIPHLYAPNNSMQMNASEFVKALSFIRENGNIINTQNATISEKVDGAGIRFGQSHDGAFFIESSRSGPIFESGAFSRFAESKYGTKNAISKGYDDMFDMLSKDVNVIALLNKHNKGNGIKIIGEVLLRQFGTINETDPNLIRMVTTWYDVKSLGTFATFILFDVQNDEGITVDSCDKIISEFVSLASTKEMKFATPKIEQFSDVNFADIFSDETSDIKNEIINVVDFISSKATTLKSAKERINLESQKIQKKCFEKFSNIIRSGKFGPFYEGIVVKFNNGITFKINTDAYMQSKHMV